MVELIINNQVADLIDSADTKIAVTYSIADLSSCETSKDSTTKSFKIPGTARNRKIFGFPEDLNVTNFKGQKTDLTGVVRESGTIILIGKVNLKSVDRGIDGVFFNITIVGNSRQWIDVMKDATMKGLDIGGTHTLDVAAIEAAQDADFSIYTYGLINTGMLGGSLTVLKAESSTGGHVRYTTETPNSIWHLKDVFHVGDRIKGSGFKVGAYNSVQKVIGVAGNYVATDAFWSEDSQGVIRNLSGCITCEDRPLMFNIKNLVTKMYGAAGYKVQSTFFDGTFFSRLFLLTPGFKRPAEWCDPQHVKAGLSAGGSTVVPIPFDTIVQGTPGYFDTATHEYIAGDYVHIRLKTGIKIKQAGTQDLTGMIIYNINGATNYPSNAPVGSGSIGTDFSLIEGEGDFRVNPGDRIKVELHLSTSATLTTSPDESYFEITAQPTVCKNSTIIPGDYLPDVMQIEFIKGLRHLFNLMFLTDQAMKVVYIEPRDSFFVRDKFIDLTTRLDRSSVITIEELGSDLNKQLNFQYKEDSGDEGAAAWQKLNNAVLGQHRATVANLFAQEGEKNIENTFFAPTLMDKFGNIGLNNSYAPKLWKQLEEGQEVPDTIEEFEPRILYYGGLTGCDPAETWNWEGTLLSNYPYFYSHDESSANDNSLNFETIGTTRGLFDKYYFNYLKTVNESRKITAYFKLNAIDVSSFQMLTSAMKDFRALVQLRHLGEYGNYRIDSIVDFSPGSGKTTKVVLVKDVDRQYVKTIPEVHEVVFINNTNSIALHDAHANGGVLSKSTVWSTARGAASGNSVYGDSSAQGIGAYYTYHINAYLYFIERGFLYFNTAGLPDGCTIVEASLNIYKLGGDLSQEIAVFAGVQSDVLTAADFDAFGSVLFGVSAGGNLGLRTIQLNQAGIDSINKSGWTKFALRNYGFDSMNLPPTQNYATFKTLWSGAASGQTNYLKVKYTL